ncbi:Sterol uptake control protein 2, partial [Madurella mycetomatis]
MQAFPNTDAPFGMGYAHSSGPSPPLLTLDANEVADFDYSAYVQDQQDMDYLAEESSASVSTPPLPSSSSDAPPQTLMLPQLQPSSSALIVPRAGSGSGGGSGTTANTGSGPQKQRLERRGHTKSRRGCFNCKRRRIKCQETRPACGHCVKTGLKCEYPTLPAIVHQPQHQIPIFTLQDMRFFQHFLLKCYPHHPIGSEDMWTHEIPCLSEKMYIKGENILFGDYLESDAQKAKLQPHMEKLPLVEKQWVDAAVVAIEQLEGVVEAEGGEVERRYLELILEMARQLY